MNKALEWRWLGRMNFAEALALQEELVARKRENRDTIDELLLLEHEPVGPELFFNPGKDLKHFAGAGFLSRTWRRPRQDKMVLREVFRGRPTEQQARHADTARKARQSAFSQASRAAAFPCDRDNSGSPLGNVHLFPPFVLTSRNSTEGPRRR